MSIWSGRDPMSRRSVGVLVAGILITLAGMIGGGLMLAAVENDDSGGSDVPPPVLSESGTTTTTPAPTVPPAASRGPELVSWGGHGTHLALAVRNTGPRQIRSARVRITALDAAGRTIVSTTGPPGSKCCTVLGLPPGAEYGLFLGLERDVAEVADVRVRYADVRTEPTDAAGQARIDVSDAVLLQEGSGAVVEATFAASGSASPYVVGQAFLVDRKGDLVGVISGRFYCFRDGDRRRVRMEFFRPVPKGTRLSETRAYPIPEGEPAHVPSACG